MFKNRIYTLFPGGSRIVYLHSPQTYPNGEHNVTEAVSFAGV